MGVTGIRLAARLVFLIPLFGTACADEAICVPADTECAPLYEPTFENVFNNTLKPSCGVSGVACHAREGARGELVFEDIDEAYAQLVGAGGSPSRVDFSHIGCGALLSRLNSDDADYQMPPGARLPEAELCAVNRWVLDGAQR